MSKLHVLSTSSAVKFPVPGVPQDMERFDCDWDTESEDRMVMPRLVSERLIACLTLS